jgi:capsular polysaccharide biosynthesis protein
MTVTGQVAPGEQVSYRSYDYVGLLRRRWWILVLGLILGGLAGWGATKVVPKTYTSSTLVFVQVGSGTTQSARTSGTGIDVDNEAQLVTSTIVGQDAQHQLKTSVPVNTLLEDITVTVPANTAFLTISCDQPTPSAAQACSQAFAQAYINVRSDQQTKATQQQLAALTTQIADVQAQIRTIGAQLAVLSSDSTAHQIAQIQSQVLVQELNNLITQQQSLLAPPVAPAVITSNANLPTSPSSPVKVLFIASGVLVGLLIALLLAVLLQRMDRRVHDARSLRNSRVPVLSDITMGGRRRNLSLVNATMPGAHSFGLLSNVVLARLERGSHLVVGVVGVKPGNAASVVAASLSDSLAGSGRRIVHIVADPASASPSLLGAPKGPGLADALERPEPDAIEHLPGWGTPFQVITPGRASDKLGRWLGSEPMTRLLGRVREQADLVVFEAPDLTSSADSYAIALSADATVIVVEAGRTTVDEVDQALDQFARLGVPVIGLVLVSGMPPVQVSSTQPAPAPLAVKATTANATASAAASTTDGASGGPGSTNGLHAGPSADDAAEQGAVSATDAAGGDAGNAAGSNGIAGNGLGATHVVPTPTVLPGSEPAGSSEPAGRGNDLPS